MSFDAMCRAAERHIPELASKLRYASLLRTNAANLLTVQDLIAHAGPAEQAALLADWHDLVQGQRDHALWKTAFRWSDGKVVNLSARLSGVHGADGQVEQVASLLEIGAAHG